MPSYTAPAVLTPDGLRAHWTVVCADDGTVQALHDHPTPDALPLEGLLSPGFVNAHCHLELSHLAGAIPAGVGMVGFITQLMGMRGNYTPEQAQTAAHTALEQMAQAGVAAVGDIANGPDSFPAKQALARRVAVHTFVELLGVDPTRAEAALQRGLDQLLQAPQPASLAPHAPYSTSEALFQHIYRHADGFPAHTPAQRLSLHLLESEAEREWFAQRTGPFTGFYDWLGRTLVTDAQSPIDHALTPPPASPLLLVHLTEATAADVQHLQALEAQGAQFFYCLCPRSNRYLHGKLPPAPLFPLHGTTVCLGTDSAASNWSLDMALEMAELQSAFPALSTETLLFCATRNGAHALGMEHTHGTLSPGKRPGLALLSGLDASFRFTQHTTSRRIL